MDKILASKDFPPMSSTFSVQENLEMFIEAG
jgi:hypothetical protein